MLINIVKALKSKLEQTIALNPSLKLATFEDTDNYWAADIGVGLMLVKHPDTLATDALIMGQRMSRTAMSYNSRLAWFDYSSGETVELPDARLL